MWLRSLLPSFNLFPTRYSPFTIRSEGMVILGIDPGSRVAGYGLIKVEDDGEERLLECGVLRFKSTDSHQLRLKQIYDRLLALVEACPPDECAVEMPVYGRNPQSMLKLGRAQAAAMLVALNRGIPVTEYTPKAVKKSVTGNGNASKQQVAFMVRSVLGIGQDAALGLDASDALAVGLCHAHRLAGGTGGATAKKHGGWASFVQANPGRVKG